MLLLLLHRVVGFNSLHVRHRAAMLPEAWHRRLPTGLHPSHPATPGRSLFLWGYTHRGLHPRTCHVPVSTEVTFVLSLVAMGLTTSCVMVRNWDIKEGLPGFAGPMNGYPGRSCVMGSQAATL